ncbi:MAG: nucleotidyltransferase domain-containing protein [Clostridiales bacterium]|jgi:hypothetical protein|nr:nucleotidyltransferase domain-containing protein [Clostridiales bacterium]
MALNQEIADITETIKFGSYAYGTPNGGGGCDFFVVIPDGVLRPLEAAQRARKTLIHWDRKTPANILADCKSRFDGRKQYNTVEKNISNEGAALYGH